MADSIVLLSMLAVLALLGFGLQRYLRRCCAQHTILQSVLRGLFIGLACSLLITTLIILYNPVAAYAERAHLQSYVVVIYVAGGMALAFFLALLGIAAVMTFRGGYRHQLLKNSAVFVERLTIARKHAGKVWMERRGGVQNINNCCHRGHVHLARGNHCDPAASVEQGSAYDPLDKWMNPRHPAHPLLYDLLDD